MTDETIKVWRNDDELNAIARACFRKMPASLCISDTIKTIGIMLAIASEGIRGFEEDSDV